MLDEPSSTSQCTCNSESGHMVCQCCQWNICHSYILAEQPETAEETTWTPPEITEKAPSEQSGTSEAVPAKQPEIPYSTPINQPEITEEMTAMQQETTEETLAEQLGSEQMPLEQPETAEEILEESASEESYITIPNRWTISATGCPCSFDRSRTDCACCASGGCVCGRRINPNLCVKCGQGRDCVACEYQTFKYKHIHID